MQSTRGLLYIYIPGGFNYSDPVRYIMGSKVRIIIIRILRRGYDNMYIFRRSVPACDKKRQITTNNKKFQDLQPLLSHSRHKRCATLKKTWLGIIKSLQGTQLLHKISKLEEEVLFFWIIITGLIQTLVQVSVQFVGFHVHVQPVFINLINIGYQLLLHNINQGMPVLKIVTLIKYLSVIGF